jgi:mono/diheme cytochrome c family protein
MRFRLGVVVALVAAVSLGCKMKEFTESVKLADKVDKDGNAIPNSGETLSPKLLTDGHDAFMLYCYGCHGEKGDGFGPAAPTMRPPPRNFVQALFKFPGTAFGQLPTDAALDRTIRRGLHGTPMLAWDIPDVERKALIAYIKTLSPRWKTEGVPPEIEIAPDPWKGKSKDEAIALGKQVYHVAQDGAGCSGCHASYEMRADISEMTKKVTGEGVAEFGEEMYRTALKASEYPAPVRLGERRRGCEVYLASAPVEVDSLSIQVNGALIDRDTEHKAGWDFEPGEAAKSPHEMAKPPRIAFFGETCENIKKDKHPSILATRQLQILPPDFLFHKVKSAYPVGTMIHEGDKGNVEYTEEMQREDLYRTIGVGIGGAAMPGWKGVLPEEKLWALVYYVQSLIQQRDTPAAYAMRAKLEGQPKWEAPAPTPAPEPEKKPEGKKAPEAPKKAPEQAK